MAGRVVLALVPGADKGEPAIEIGCDLDVGCLRGADIADLQLIRGLPLDIPPGRAVETDLQLRGDNLNHDRVLGRQPVVGNQPYRVLDLARRDGPQAENFAADLARLKIAQKVIELPPLGMFQALGYIHLQHNARRFPCARVGNLQFDFKLLANQDRLRRPLDNLELRASTDRPHRCSCLKRDPRHAPQLPFLLWDQLHGHGPFIADRKRAKLPQQFIPPP